jgi:A/G-specific adenine glycosylase
MLSCPLSTTEVAEFAPALLRWQRRHGRHDLPWQSSREPYRRWVSEIMLQQTQVTTVIPYFLRFMSRFPDVASLAAAELGEVLQVWAGLGYYRRARNLHASARLVVTDYGGVFPDTSDALQRLPGIGRSTAAAIAAFAFNRRAAILDGNVKRVLARYFAVPGYPGDAAVERELWRLSEALLPRREISRYTQALMDLGALVCTRQPRCNDCPLVTGCKARREQRVAEFPAPRRRVRRPLRRARFLIALNNKSVLLVRRPDLGIWGGLLCPPELPADSELADRELRRFGCNGAGRDLPAIRHGFTHFSLDIVPLLCRAELAQRHIAEPGLVWLPLNQIGAAALPAPFKKLLLRLAGA